MSLIKEALDKAQEKTTGTSSEGVEVTVEPAHREHPEEVSSDDFSLSWFLLWSGVVLLVSALAGFEAIYLWTIL